jgi:MFS transporter, DHA1 family, multidrug resistance protein
LGACILAWESGATGRIYSYGDHTLKSNWKRTLRVIWIAQLLAIIGFSATSPIYPYYIQFLGAEEHLTARWAGFVIAAASVSMGVMGPIWGAMGDRYGRKAMVMRAMFGGAAAIVLQGFAQNVGQFFVLKFIQGALTGTVTAATALVASKTPKERLGETLGKLQLAIFLGQAFGPVVGGFVADFVGFRATFWLNGIFLLSSGMLILLLVSEEFTPPVYTGTGKNAGQVTFWRGMGQDFSMILGGSLLGLVLMLHFALRVGIRVVGPTIPLIIQDMMPGTTLLGSASGLLATTLGISSALAAPMVGRWADRKHPRDFLLAGALLSAAALFGQGVATRYWMLVVWQFVLGLGLGSTLAVISSYIGRLAPEGRVGTAFGLDAMAVSLAGAVGPSLGGWLSDTVTRQMPLYVGGVMMALASAAVLRLPRETHADAEASAEGKSITKTA